MEIRYFKHYSSHLNRDMEFKVYGHGGKPVMFIPCQGGRFFDFESFHMIDHWGRWIEEGICTVYAIDCIDNETWALKEALARPRIEQHERWYNYVIEELVPYIYHLNAERGNYDLITTFGCSMGAQHAANFLLRRPDLFGGVFAISGLYDSKDAFGDYMDDLVYNNSPVDFIANMPYDHPYIGMYNDRKILICVGQGAWEDVLLESTRRLDEVMYKKGICARFEYWGYDVNHDWPWWYKMVACYAPDFLF